MCHILLSISINFIIYRPRDVILMHNIYTFYLLLRAIVGAFYVNLFQLAMTLCLCTELNIQQIYFSIKRLKRVYIFCICVLFTIHSWLFTYRIMLPSLTIHGVVLLNSELMLQYIYFLWDVISPLKDSGKSECVGGWFPFIHRRFVNYFWL